MNKRQRNQKTVAQNQRNRMINRRYLSTIKTLFKLFSLTVKKKEEETDEIIQNSLVQKTLSLQSSLYSFLDKAVKKKVLHKNTAARKKSKIAHFSLKRKEKKA
jgi:small subunit ribosomal protein S20